VLAEQIRGVFPWPITVATFDQLKQSITLRTKNKELTFQTIDPRLNIQLFTLLSKHSLGTDFTRDYGIIHFVGTIALGRLYMVEDREDKTPRLVAVMQMKNIQEKFTEQIIQKLSQEVCQSFKLCRENSVENLICVQKMFLSDNNICFMYNFDKVGISLDQFMMDGYGIKTDDVFLVMEEITRTVLDYCNKGPYYMLEVNPRNVIISVNTDKSILE
jgi:hypothetical protein